ncbi:hypothetical protein G5V59_00700 [Nocardioides sp. W3-2-3]|nr:hypothetical protein [Nocardioides convexus]
MTDRIGKVVDEVSALDSEVSRLRPPGAVEGAGVNAVGDGQPEGDAI